MTYRPATHRAFQWVADTLSVPPVVTGIVVSLLLGGLAFWTSWISGDVANVIAGHVPSIVVRAPVTLYLLLGYLAMAVYYVSVWTASHLQTISNNFGLDNKPFLFPRRSANWIGASGVVLMYLLFLHEPNDPLLLLQPGRWKMDFAVPLVGLVFMGWFNLRFMFLLVGSAITVSRTARQLHNIDLFDTSLVKPYAQHGVRSSLLAVVCLSVSANLWLDPGSPAVASAASVVMLVAGALLALTVPTWGIHQQLKTLKQTELKKIRNAISSRADPGTRSVDDAHQLRADIALEQRLMDVSEWPFDAGSYGRVTLYVFLGFGSWVGAALVERLLESLGT